MKIRLNALLFLMFLVPGAYANENVFEEEVAHLLAYVEESGCTFTRNGKIYSSVEARAHIDRKYKHIKKRISSTEQFITYGASKSSITGKKYTVDCDGEVVPSGQWLKKELTLLRKQRSSASTGHTEE